LRRRRRRYEGRIKVPVGCERKLNRAEILKTALYSCWHSSGMIEA